MPSLNGGHGPRKGLWRKINLLLYWQWNEAFLATSAPIQVLLIKHRHCALLLLFRPALYQLHALAYIHELPLGHSDGTTNNFQYMPLSQPNVINCTISQSLLNSRCYYIKGSFSAYNKFGVFWVRIVNCFMIRN